MALSVVEPDADSSSQTIPASDVDPFVVAIVFSLYIYIYAVELLSGPRLGVFYGY